MKEYNPIETGKRLKELRTERRVGQNLLAREICVSNASISYWENGKQEPSASALLKLAQYFKVSTDYIVGLADS